MKFFGGSKKPASSTSSPSSPSSSLTKKHASSSNLDQRDDSRHSHSEPSSPAKSSSRSPKKSARPPSHREPKSPSSPRHSRLSRHSTEPPSSFSRRSKFDADTHPLNLPPEERKRLSALSQSAMSGRNSMEIDAEPVNGASPPSPNPSAQTNFAVPIPEPNGNDHEEAPVPPPHKSNPSSPVPTQQDDAEAYKAAGNRFFKDKNYSKAIEQYSKGMPLSALSALDHGPR